MAPACPCLWDYVWVSFACVSEGVCRSAPVTACLSAPYKLGLLMSGDENTGKAKTKKKANHSFMCGDYYQVRGRARRVLLK